MNSDLVPARAETQSKTTDTSIHHGLIVSEDGGIVFAFWVLSDGFFSQHLTILFAVLAQCLEAIAIRRWKQPEPHEKIDTHDVVTGYAA